MRLSLRDACHDQDEATLRGSPFATALWCQQQPPAAQHFTSPPLFCCRWWLPFWGTAGWLSAKIWPAGGLLTGSAGSWVSAYVTWPGVAFLGNNQMCCGVWQPTALYVALPNAFYAVRRQMIADLLVLLGARAGTLDLVV